jgi:hypothetical protein
MNQEIPADEKVQPGYICLSRCPSQLRGRDGLMCEIIQSRKDWQRCLSIRPLPCTHASDHRRLTRLDDRL